MTPSTICGKCKKHSHRLCWMLGDVKFLKPMCPDCSTGLYNDVINNPDQFNSYAYMIQKRTSWADKCYTTPCAAPRPDFSKEKATIKKGQIEEEIY